jgi:hypothetical protein
VLETVAARPWALAKSSTGCCICLHAPAAPHIPCPLHRRIWLSYLKWVTRLPWACLCLGSKVKPASRVRATQSNQSEGRSDTRGGQQLAHSEPHVGARHPQALYLSSDLEVSFTPSVWASIEPSGFFARITQEKCMKPPGSDLTEGGSSPCLVLWRGTCPS